MPEPEETQELVVHDSKPQDVVGVSPITLIERAIEKGTPISDLERLFDMAERWEKKVAKNEFFFAIAKFQAEIPEIKKTKRVNYASKSGGANIDYHYAPLDAIASQIKEALARNGLSYRFEFDETAEDIAVSCIVSHSGGHCELTTMSAPPDTSGKKNNIQSRGSTLTYMQRYTLIGAFGLTTANEDDDGRGADPARVYERNDRATVNKHGIMETMERLFDNPQAVVELRFKGHSIHDLNNDQLIRLQSFVGAYENYINEVRDCKDAGLDDMIDTYAKKLSFMDPELTNPEAIRIYTGCIASRRHLASAKEKMGDKIYTTIVNAFLVKGKFQSLASLPVEKLQELVRELAKVFNGK